MVVKFVQTSILISAVGFTIYPFVNDADKPAQPVVKQAVTQATAVKLEVKSSPLPDFASIRDVKQKKREFFSYLEPMVDDINRDMLSIRARILEIQSSTNPDQNEIAALATKFKVKPQDNVEQTIEQLLIRVDVLPVELVLMQAANESGWGTSRFAVSANNLFGQWCFKKGCGLVPQGRPEGKTYEVRKFNSPKDSVRSYFHNLNTGYAYADLRLIRQRLRSETGTIDAVELANGLLPYSTRRQAYVEEIQTMIAVNKKYLNAKSNS